MMSSNGTEKVANKKKEDESSTNLSQDAETGPLLLPSLYRLTEGIRRKELKLMVSLPARSLWSQVLMSGHLRNDRKCPEMSLQTLVMSGYLELSCP
jgi:hypothetical protein